MPLRSQIQRITELVEQRTGAFGVARLIMMSGVAVRAYASDSLETPEDIRRVRIAA
ncbi:MAG: hypothetical protein AAFY60_17120 [Myxococcota bacterium]